MTNGDDDRTDATPAPAAPHTRRDFLRATAAAAGASLLASCIRGSGSSDPEPLLGLAPPYMAGIERLVVVMMENRSFDNLLGYLYADDLTQPPPQWPAQVGLPYALPPGKKFEGLWQFKVSPANCTGTPGSSTCSGTLGSNYDAGTWYGVHPHDFAPTSTLAADWAHPSPNPGEGHRNTVDQLAAGTMNGFAANYAQAVAKTNTGDTVTDIMGSFTPAQLPVLSGLAWHFAVFDHWHCAVPSETYCNRSFFHASTSSGYVYNAPTAAEKNAGLTEEAKWALNTAPTVFERLAATPDPATGQPVAWRVYASTNATYPQGLTAFIHPKAAATYTSQFVGIDEFCQDVACGNLPRYSFVETLYGGEADFHPPQDVRSGEEVLRQVYEAIRTSGTNGKRDYTRDTMILIVFDEHGGTYDHVVPPRAPAPPAATNAVPDSSFDFKDLGVRVPAIAISSYTLPNTIVNTPVHHAAVIRTLARKYGFAPLNARDADPGGGDLSLAYNVAVPRAPSDWPAFTTPVSAKAVKLGCGTATTCPKT